MHVPVCVYVGNFTCSGLRPGGTQAYSSRAQPESSSEVEFLWKSNMSLDTVLSMSKAIITASYHSLLRTQREWALMMTINPSKLLLTYVQMWPICWISAYEIFTGYMLSEGVLNNNATMHISFQKTSLYSDFTASVIIYCTRSISFWLSKIFYGLL